MNILNQEMHPTAERVARAGVAALAAVAALVMVPAAHAAGAGMTVTKDPVTGELRLPNAQERAALERVKAKEKAAASALQKQANGKAAPVAAKNADAVNPEIYHVDGSVEMQLDEESMVYSVAKRNPDGSISMECVTGSKSADRFLKAKSGAVAKSSRSNKGDGHDHK